MQTFTPFPLRARGLLEIFDAAIKLYKQYFWVLVGWSAIVSITSVLGSLVPFVNFFISFFLTPLAIGSVVCCIAAAVRGQNVEFGQCWQFIQPRYWMMLGLYVLACIVGSLILLVIFGIMAALGVGGVFLFRESGGVIQVVMAVLGFSVLIILAVILSAIVFSWIGLVPIVVCMEEDKRGTMALNRAYEILRGHWIQITTLVVIVGLAMLALFGMLAGLTALVVGVGRIGDLANGRGFDEASVVVAMVAAGITYVVFLIVSAPLMYLILSVFYLDVRVRHEALDLEWTAHATAPPGANAPAPGIASPTFIATPNQATPVHQEYSPPATMSQSQSGAVENVAPPQNPFGTRPLNDDSDTGSTPGAPL